MSEVLIKVAKDVLRDYYCQISHQDSESQPFGLLQAVRERAWGAYRAMEAKLGRTEEKEKPISGEPLRSSFRRPPYADPETADISEAERRRAYLASAEYQQRRQKLMEWEQRQRAQAAYEHYRQGERAEPQAVAPQDTLHGVISSLPSIVDGINAIREVIKVSKASRQVNSIQVGNQIVIRGPRSARQVLGLNPYINRISIKNAPRLLAETPMTRAFRSVTSSWTLASVLLNAGVDYYSYRTGEYDRQEFGAALLFDTAATIISAAVAGLVAGAVAGAIAGTPALGIGAVPGAVIGGIAGAVVGIVTSLALNYYVRDWYIATASHGWDWLGR